MNDRRVETRRLRLLLELSRLGSMREVADAMHITTSTVSQQLAALAREAGATLIEPDGRRVRLTPAGRRLAAHAVTILAAVDAARLDLDPAGEPVGTLRVAGFATAVRRSLLPVMRVLAADHPRVRLHIAEHEPLEAYELLAADAVDLALTYDYDLAPAVFDPAVDAVELWRAPWALGVPATGGANATSDGGDAGNDSGDAADGGEDAIGSSEDPAGGSEDAIGGSGDAAGGGGVRAALAAARRADWIVNSRNTADEVVVRTVAALAGFEPRVVHRADSLSLLQDMIVAGLGVGLLPADQSVLPGVRLVPLRGPEVHLRCYAVTRRGRETWPALALVLSLLQPT